MRTARICLKRRVLTLSFLISLIYAEAIPEPTAAPAPAPIPGPPSLDLNALTPDDIILDGRDFTNSLGADVILENRGYGGGSNPNYGGGNCPGCAQQSHWAPTSHWVPASTWQPQPAAVTVIRTETYCPHCEQPTTYYRTTTYCPPSSTWRPQSTWRPAPTSVWHTSYVQPAPVVTETVQPQAVTTVVAQSQVPGAICGTLIANGPGLPTTRQGDCGTILVINGAVQRGSSRALWMALAGSVMGLLLGAI